MKFKSVFGALLLCLAPFGAQAQEVVQSASSLQLPDDVLIEVDSVALDQALRQLADQIRLQGGVQQVRQTSAGQDNMVSYILLLHMLQSRNVSQPMVQYRTVPSQSQQATASRDVDRLEGLLEQILLSQGLRQPSNSSTYLTTTTPQQSNEAEIARLQALESQVQTLLNELKSAQSAPLAQGLTETQTVFQTDTLTLREASDFKRSVYFSVGSATLSARARKTLSEAVSFLNRFPSARLSLAGYSSPEGSVALNERLANDRIKAVLDFLEQSGISSERLIRQAGAIESTSLARQLGRRVDLSLVL